MAALTDVRADAANTVMRPDQRDADHQRGGGRRGALRVAHRVLARDQPGDALELLDRDAERAADRRRDHGPEHRDADEHDEHADADVDEPAVAEQAQQQERQPEQGDDDADHRADRRRAGAVDGGSRMAAIGGMRDARSAGASAASTVTTMPSTYDQMSAVAGMAMFAGGDVESEGARAAPSTRRRGRSRPRSRRSTPPTRPAPPRTSRNRPPARAPRRARATSASSRMRCATTIEKVLKMMNEPTSRATIPKINRNVLKKERFFSRLL